MEPILLILLIIAALAVALVWIAVVAVVMVVRAIVWSVKLPVRALRTVRTPAVPLPIMTQMQCGNEKCNAPLPNQARFCPRCGTGVTSVIDVPASLHRNSLAVRARVA